MKVGLRNRRPFVAALRDSPLTGISCLAGCDRSTAPSTMSVAVFALGSSVALEGRVPGAGQTSRFTARATLLVGTGHDVTAIAVWASSDTRVATVTSGGLLPAVAVGHRHSHCRLQGLTGQFPVNHQEVTFPDAVGGVGGGSFNSGTNQSNCTGGPGANRSVTVVW